MCNLYSQTRNVEAIRSLFRVPHNRSGEIKPQTSIFPGYTAPVIRCAEDGERELVHKSWGFVLLHRIAKAGVLFLGESELHSPGVAFSASHKRKVR